MKKVKWLVALVLIFSILSVSALAADEISVTINEKIIEFDVQPQLINNRTMVPMRKIFEELGANVEWIDEMQLVMATYGPKIVAMEIGLDSFSITDASLGETKTIPLDSPAVIVDGRTLIPVRAVAECFGYSVSWNDATQTVIISK